MDLDLALTVDSPTLVTDLSTFDQKREFERWERSNRLCMFIKRAIPKAFRGTMSDDITIAKAFLTNIEKRFVKNKRLKLVQF